MASNNAPVRANVAPTQSLELNPLAEDAGIEKRDWLALCNLYPGARPESKILVFEYCKARGLDPLKKPVHIVPMWIEDKATGRKGYQDVIMPGIAETRTTAARTNHYAGIDEPEFGPAREYKIGLNATDKDATTISAPEYCKITVYRLIGNKRMPFTHIEFFAEAVARTRDGVINEMWKKRPRGQLAKCAEAGALRKAFPEELGGEVTADEMFGRDAIEGDFAEVHEHIPAQGIPEPAEIPDPEDVPDPAAAERPAAEKPPKDEPGDDGVSDEEKADAVRKAAAAARKEKKAKPEEPAKEAPKAESPPKSADFKVNLPEGALSIVTRKLREKGQTEAWLLGKLNADLTTANINQALALLR